MQTINLESTKAGEELQSIEGSMSFLATGYNATFMCYFDKKGIPHPYNCLNCTEDEAVEMIDLALGNISEQECSWYEEPVPSKDEIEIEREYQRNRYHGAGCLPFDGGVM